MAVLVPYFANTEAGCIERANFAELAIALDAVIVKEKVGKARDIEMLLSIFQFVFKLPEKNLTLFSLGKIRDNRVAEHYRELQRIRQIGPKVASFYLRDLVCVYGINDLVRPEDLKLLQPIDVWLRKVVCKLGIIERDDAPEDEVRSNIIDGCPQAGVAAFKFNQGAWYLGKYAFDLLIEQLDKFSFES